MAQPSVYFSAGRLTMLQRNVLDAAGMERLLSTASLPEARKTLSELGWTGADITDPEQLAADRVNQAAQDARALSPDPALVDCFLYAYDAANLKMLLKARLLGLSAPALSDCGTIPADALRHAVTDHRYSTLPAAFRDAMNRLEQNIVTGIDPMSIDVAIDRAMYQLIFSRLKGTHSPVTLQYFRGHVDLLNAVALLRVRQMKKDESFFMSVLLSGGTIRAQSWRLCFAQPDMLPASFPNLLVNGSSGIAVGMATNIPPHNLREVIDACVCVLDNPEATMSELLQHVTGPDFPTKGIIMGRSGIRAAYATGRGKITVRARTEFEEFGQNRERIIVTELPYQVNKRQLIKNIAEQVKDKRLDGISDLRDETDRNGMRIVIELKKDANPQVVLNNLFKQTALQSSFGIIMLALVDNQKQPKILSLRQIIDEYLKHQEEVLTRRTRYDLKKAQERAHLLEGLLIAQDNIDEVIHIIRSAYDDAKQRLMDRFKLDDVQAQAILDMRLKALQGLDREKLQSEYDELEEKIKYYLELLADEKKLKAVLRSEMIEIRDKFGDKRKTEIQEIEDEIDIEDLIEEETCAFTLSNQGYIKRMPVDTYRTQSRGGRGVNAQNLKEEDYVKSLTIASTHDHMLFFTDQGRVHHRKGYQIPEAGRTPSSTCCP